MCDQLFETPHMQGFGVAKIPYLGEKGACQEPHLKIPQILTLWHSKNNQRFKAKNGVEHCFSFRHLLEYFNRCTQSNMQVRQD